MRRRCFSTIELLVALAVMTIVITASTIVSLSTPNIIADAKRAASALAQARNTLAVASSTVDEPREDENFVRRVAQTTWVNSHAEPRLVSFSTIISNSTEPLACDPFTSGDWTQPKLIQSYALRAGDLTPSEDGVYSLSSLSISPSLLIIGVASTSQATASTLFFFRLTGTSTPNLIGTFDNASTSRIGIDSVASHGNFVFAGNGFSSASPITCTNGVSCAQIYSFNSQSSLPLSSLALSAAVEPFAYQADGSNASVSALFFYRGLLYVGLQKTVRGDEFNLIDARDPSRLRWLSGYQIGRTVNGITVHGNYAYVSTDDPLKELMVFDVQDSSQIKLVAVWDAPGAISFGYGSATTVFGNTIRFGRTYTGNGPEFEILRLASSTFLEISRVDSGVLKDPESVRALVTQDRLTFMLLTHRLEVLDTHNRDAVQLIGTYALPPGSQGVTLACRNNQLYLARNESDGSGSIDILQGA